MEKSKKCFVTKCSSCGQDHYTDFYPISSKERSARDIDNKFTHVGECSNTLQSIFMVALKEQIYVHYGSNYVLCVGLNSQGDSNYTKTIHIPNVTCPNCLDALGKKNYQQIENAGVPEATTHLKSCGHLPYCGNKAPVLKLTETLKEVTCIYCQKELIKDKVVGYEFYSFPEPVGYTPGKIVAPTKIEFASHDSVNNPSHYTDGKIEVITFIEDKRLGFNLGNAVKYISRAGKKDPLKHVEDLEKAAWYLNREINNLKGLKNENN